MNRILMIGTLGYWNNQLDGQTIKTRNIFRLLTQRYKGRTDACDTLRLKRNPLMGFKLLWQLMRCDTVVIVPCGNNLTYLFPVVYFLSKIFRYEIVHICIGGWQLEYFKTHPLQLKLSRKIKAVLTEIVRVERDLRSELGFENVETLLNFRDIDTSLVNRNSTPTLKLVFLARIDKDKGYHTIFNFADYARDNGLDVSVTFYGMITQRDRNDFMALVGKHAGIVSYGGILAQEAIPSTLVNYDIMLLPTRFYTEGLPGTIIDAYTASLPVVVTEWKHAREFVDDGRTGVIVPWGDCQREFNSAILGLYNDRERLSDMKREAKSEVLRFTEDAAWQVLSKYLTA